MYPAVIKATGFHNVLVVWVGDRGVRVGADPCRPMWAEPCRSTVHKTLLLFSLLPNSFSKPTATLATVQLSLVQGSCSDVCVGRR